MENEGTVSRVNHVRWLLRFWIAEVRKMFAFRSIRIAYIAVFIFVGVIACRLYLTGRVKFPGNVNGLTVAPILFSYTWAALAFQVYIICMSVYAVLIESQYGMIRVVLIQPLPRPLYVLGKYGAVLTQAGIFTMAFMGSHVFWSFLLWGTAGITSFDIRRHALFWLYTIIFILGLSAFSIGAGFFRRTIASGMLTAWSASMVMLLLGTFSPDMDMYVFFKYGFFPLQPVSYIDNNLAFYWSGHTLLGYLGTVIITPILIGIPSVMRFLSRDITE